MTKKYKVRCDVYSKIVGYCRRISNWNKGKQQEWKDRHLLSLK